MNPTQEEIEEFHKNIIITKRKDDGKEHCWLWHGKHMKGGYGIYQTLISNSSHQFAYRLYNGDIPDGKVIDHLCEITACCNPNHLEAVTHSENMRRIHSRQNIIQQMYDVAYAEYDIGNNLPISSALKKCVEGMERRWLGIGYNFENYTSDLGEKSVTNIIITLLHNRFTIFAPDYRNYDEVMVNGYKRKWLHDFILEIFEFFETITLKEFFDYYIPVLLEYDNGKFKGNLDHKIDRLLDWLEECEITSYHQIKNQITYHEMEIEKLHKKGVKLRTDEIRSF